MRIRFRTDSYSEADDAARLRRGHAPLWHDAEELVGVEPASPGDCWRVRWYKSDGEGPIAGYAICCALCLQVHSWTTALNCGSRNAQGSCEHNGVSSCWQWTGSAEDGTLTASPSLHAIDQGGCPAIDNAHGCGWHGWLLSGELTPC